MDSYSQICLGCLICIILTFVFTMTGGEILPRVRKRHDRKNKQMIDSFRYKGWPDIPYPEPVPKYVWETVFEILSFITGGMSISFFISTILID